MNWIDQSIREFGNSIGIASLRFDEDGVLRLGTGSGGSIEVHHQRDQSPPTMLVIASEPIGFNGPARLREALKLADFRRQCAWPLHVALDGDQLVLAARMDERSFSHSALETVLDQLDALHQQLAERS